MSLLDQPRPSDQQLGDRFEFETLLADLSSRFINLPPGEVDHEIEHAQRRICEHLGLDLSSLWQWSPTATMTLTLTHLCRLTDRPSTPARMAAEDYFPWIQQQQLAGRTLALSSMADLPPAAARDHETFGRYGIKATLIIPLSVGGGPPVGTVSFATLREERDWPEALVKRLQLVAQIFANALARKRSDEALRESEARLNLAVDSAEAGLWVLDYHSGQVWVTERAKAIFGDATGKTLGLDIVMASIHPDDRDLVQNAIERSARTSEPVNVECRILPREGGVRWVVSRGRPHFTDTGEPARLMGVSIDITERRRAEEALRASETRLTSGADLAGLGFYDADFAAGIVYIDDRLRDLFGIPPDREHGLDPMVFWLEHVHQDDTPLVLNTREQLLKGQLDHIAFEYRYRHPVRGVVWINHLARVLSRDTSGRGVRTLGVLRDVTERKRAEDDLRDLSRRLIRAHEEERALLARELHDDLTQRLAVMAIDVGRAELAAPDPEQAKVMRMIREELVRLSDDVHSIAYHLHPSVLKELGLARALRAECERRRRHSRFKLSVDLDPLPAVIEKEAALCLFRVAQEALNNVTRHSGARTASVTLRQMDGGFVLAVRDDGVGFDPNGPGKRKALGLASMRDRVRLANGTLDIESMPGQGTTVVAWVPAEREEV